MEDGQTTGGSRIHWFERGRRDKLSTVPVQRDQRGTVDGHSQHAERSLDPHRAELGGGQAGQGAAVAGDHFKLLDEGQPGNQLRNYHVVTPGQVDARGCDSDLAGQQPGLGRVFAPPTQLPPDEVDIQIERERVLIGV